MKNNTPTITPLDRLLADKQRLQIDCTKSASVLDQDLAFLHENALSVLSSSVGYLFFSSKNKNKGGENPKAHPSDSSAKNAHSSIPLGLNDYLSVARNFVPTLWSIARPMIISWGVSRFQKWLVGKFLKKRGAHE